MHRTTDLAEIVSNPSPITLTYLRIWFCGRGSYGAALTKLGWPANRDSDEPLLVLDAKGGLCVDVGAEERIMYRDTVFQYIHKKNQHALRIDPRKLTFRNIVNTMRSVWSQSKLLVNCQSTYDLSKSYVEQIPLHVSGQLREVERALKDIVWPNVIAVDYIGEYVLSILTHGLTPEKKLDALSAIHARVRDIDWYTKAILSWSDYKEGLLSEQDLLDKYGYVAGDDYELTRPRYYELLHKPKPHVGTLAVKDMKVASLEDLAVGMHYLRSEVKRRSLVWIAGLREHLLQSGSI